MAFLLKFLFVVFLIGFLLREIVRFILPRAIGKYMKNIQQQQQNIYNEEKAGKTTIKSSPADKDDKLRGKGEYVDFEEVD
jgi:hypothetical protein